MNFSYPISLNVANKKCTVIGGGIIAERKVKTLLSCQAIVEVISPEVTEEISLLSSQGKITWCKATYDSEFIKKSFLVIAATNNRKVNKSIANDCHQYNILVNVVDSPEDSNFIVNAFFRQGDLTLSVSTNGKSPALARKIKDDLKKIYGPEYGILLDILGEVRLLAPKKISSQTMRKNFFQDIIDSDILEMIRAGYIDEARERMKQCLLSY